MVLFYRVIFVLSLHVVLDELDIADGLLQLDRVAFAASQTALAVGRTQVGRHGRRRRRRRWRRRRRRQIVKVDYFAEQLRSVVDAARPPTAVVGIQSTVGDVLTNTRSNVYHLLLSYLLRSYMLSNDCAVSRPDSNNRIESNRIELKGAKAAE